jgi:S1-C subfamily serine protease
MIYASDGETYQQGSGVYVDYDEVLTAYHIVDENRTQIRTAVDKNDPNKMTVLSFDSNIDITVLTPTAERKPAKIGDSDEVKSGDKVIFIGSPDGKSAVIQTTVKHVAETIAINAEVKSGASGGALFSMDGELLGILVSGNDGLKECYIVPINEIRKSL